MRTIDADALKKLVKEFRDDAPHAQARQYVCNVVLSMLGDENQTPTIDAVPVVRCRDCVNWAGDPAKKPEYAGCWRYGAAHGIIVHENGFCDKGMRRTGL